MSSPQLTQSDDTVATSQEELSDFALTQILTSPVAGFQSHIFMLTLTSLFDYSLTLVSTDSATSSPIRREISKLTSKQQEAVNLINNKKSLFITGGAGTGKSHILRYVSETKKLIKLAPTGTSFINSLTYSHIHTQLLIGISAAGIEGMTYHSKLNFIPKRDAETSYTNVASDIEKNIENIKFER